MVEFYRDSTASYVFASIVLWLYEFLYVFWVILLLFVNIIHTYFMDLAHPGTLFSMRYRSLLWVALMLSGLRIFVPIMSVALMKFERSRECTTVWLTVLGLLTTIEVFVFFFIIGQFWSANSAGDYFNFCNALEYCCPYWADPHCPRTGPCTNPSILTTDLTRNGLCKLMTFTSIPFTLFTLILFLWPLMRYLYSPTFFFLSSRGEKGEKGEKREKEIESMYTSSAIREIPSIARKRK